MSLAEVCCLEGKIEYGAECTVSKVSSGGGTNRILVLACCYVENLLTVQDEIEMHLSTDTQKGVTSQAIIKMWIVKITYTRNHLKMA